MFSSLVRGSGTWDGGLQLIQDDLVQPPLDVLFPSISKSPDHKTTINHKPDDHGAAETDHAGSIELPKTFLTRKGAIVLFASPKERKDSTKLEQIDVRRHCEYPGKQATVSDEQDLQFIQEDLRNKDNSAVSQDQDHLSQRRRLFVDYLQGLVRKQDEETIQADHPPRYRGQQDTAVDSRGQLLRPKTIGSLFHRRSPVGWKNQQKLRPRTVCSTIPPEPEQPKAHPRITSAKPNPPTRALGKLSFKKNIPVEFDVTTLPHSECRAVSPSPPGSPDDPDYQDDPDRYSSSRYRPISRTERGHVSRASSASRYSTWWMIDDVSLSNGIPGNDGPSCLSVADNSVCPEIIECLTRDYGSLDMYDINSRPVSSMWGSTWELCSDPGISMVNRSTTQQSEYQDSGTVSKMSSRFDTGSDGAMMSRPASSRSLTGTKMTSEPTAAIGGSDSPHVQNDTSSGYGESRPPTRNSLYATTYDGDDMVNEDHEFSPSHGSKGRPPTRNSAHDNDDGENDAVVDYELPLSSDEADRRRPPARNGACAGVMVSESHLVTSGWRDLHTANSGQPLNAQDRDMSRRERNMEYLKLNSECSKDQSRVRSAPLFRKSISSRKPRFFSRRSHSAGSMHKGYPTDHPTLTTTTLSPSPPPPVSYHVRVPSISSGGDTQHTNSDDEDDEPTPHYNVPNAVDTRESYGKRQTSASSVKENNMDFRTRSDSARSLDIVKNSNPDGIEIISISSLENTNTTLNQEISSLERTKMNENAQADTSMVESSQSTSIGESEERYNLAQENIGNDNEELLVEQPVLRVDVDKNEESRQDDLRSDSCILNPETEESFPVTDTVGLCKPTETVGISSSFVEDPCNNEDIAKQKPLKEEIIVPDEEGTESSAEQLFDVSEVDCNEHSTPESGSVEIPDTKALNRVVIEDEVLEEPDLVLNTDENKSGSILLVENIDESVECLKTSIEERLSGDTQVIYNYNDPGKIVENVKDNSLQDISIPEVLGSTSTKPSKPILQENENDKTDNDRIVDKNISIPLQSEPINRNLVLNFKTVSGDSEPIEFSKSSDSNSVKADEKSIISNSVKGVNNSVTTSVKFEDNSTTATAQKLVENVASNSRQDNQSSTISKRFEIGESKPTETSVKTEKAKIDEKLDIQGIGNADNNDKRVEKREVIIREKVDLSDMLKKNNTSTKNRKPTSKTNKPLKRNKAREEPNSVELTLDVIPAVDENLLKALENPDALVELSEEALNQFAPIENFEDPELSTAPEQRISNAHSPSKVKKFPRKTKGGKRKGKVLEKNGEVEERKRKIAEEKERQKEELRLLKEREEEQKRKLDEMKEKQKTIEEEREKRLEQEAEAKQLEQEAMVQLKEAKRKAKEEREKRREEEAERRKQEVQRKREEKRQRELEIQEREKELEKQRWDREERMAELQARREREKELERMAEEQRQEEERLRLLDLEEEQRLEEERIREAEEAVHRVAREREYREQMRKIAEAQQVKLEKQETERRARDEQERRAIEEQRTRLEQEQLARENEERERVRKLRHQEAVARMRAAHEASKRRAWALRQRERNIERMTHLKHTRQSQKITEAFTFTYHVQIPRKVWELPYNWNSKTTRRAVKPRKKKTKPQ